MKNIKNLVLLQFENLFALKKYTALAVGLAIFIAYAMPHMLPYAGGILIMGTCYNSAFYEEKGKINYLIHSLPVKSSEYILSKYIFVAINTLISMIILSILAGIKQLGGANITPMWILILILGAIGILTMTILIPLQILLDTQKARFILSFLIAFTVIYSITLAEILPTINFNNGTFKLLIVLCILTLILVSYFITSNLYAKKNI